MSEANDITAELLDRIPREFPNIRIWRNNRMKALALGRGGRLRMIDAGVNGQADLSGITGPTGKRIELEVKAGRDRLSIDQINFGNMIRSLGGIYLVVRDVEAGMKALKEAMDGN